MDFARLAGFWVSYFLIAISPGLCMTLAMSLGISVGVRRALWMMLGELAGIALVGTAALVGAGAILTRSPVVFSTAKVAGAAYLVWTAARAWRAPPHLAAAKGAAAAGAGELASQGFVTAASNPKAWVFFAALLPPFVDPEKPLGQQSGILLCSMILIEFACLLIYAQGGRMLRDSLTRRGLGQWLNRVSASLMVVIAIWLVATS